MVVSTMDTLGLLPHACSSHRMSLGIQLCSVHKVGRPARASTWMLGTLSLQLMGQRRLACGDCSVFALAWQRLSRINSIQEGANYAGVAHCHLDWNGQLGVLPGGVVSHPRVVAVLPMRLLISGSKDSCITISS